MKASQRYSKVVAAVALLLVFGCQISTAFGQGTAFTYQGQLAANGSPLDGSYDLTFTLFGGSTGGSALAPTVTQSAVGVTNGLFTTLIDFGAGAFIGGNNWLEIAVRTNATGSFITLTPRQQITPTPYAISAANVTGIVPGGSLSGTYGGAVTFNNGNNIFDGNGAGLAGLNANNLANGVVPSAALGNAWKTTGNAGTSPGANFIGTTDNQALELHVNGARVLRLQPIIGGAPSIVGGSSSNSIDSTVKGAVIGGGDSNSIQELSQFSIISGGQSNQIQYASFNSTIGGGLQNNMAPNVQYSSIAGGQLNNIDNTVFGVSIGGGLQNDLQTFVQLSSIGGGYLNQIQELASYSSIGGGRNNVIQTNTAYAVIGGGFYNAAGANYSSVTGGSDNSVVTNSEYSAIVGGEYNLVESSYSSIINGYFNTISTNANYSIIGSGDENNIQSNAFNSVIGGGLFNDIFNDAQYAVIGGGDNNHENTNSSFSVIDGGSNNTIDTNAQDAVIAGGQLNTVSGSGYFSTIGGGKANTIGVFDQYATVAGGGQNTANNDFAAVGGGAYNFAGGYAATVAGGLQNNAAGDYSFAAGAQADAAGDRSFVWNSFPNPNYVTGTNEFYVFAENGFSVDYNTQRSDGGGTRWVYIGKGTGGTFGTVSATISTWTTAYLSDGGAWTSASDRARKENFAPVDSRSILDKVAALPLQTWNYTNEPAGMRHLGPVSQDFHAAFGLNGDDDKHIADVDEGGVALAAIQGLNQKLAEKDGKIQALEQRNDSLATRLDDLEKLVQSLAQKK